MADITSDYVPHKASENPLVPNTNDVQLAASKRLIEYQNSTDAPEGAEKQGVVSKLYECLLVTLRGITQAFRRRDLDRQSNENDNFRGPPHALNVFVPSIRNEEQSPSSPRAPLEVESEIEQCRKLLERIYHLFRLWGDGFDIQNGELDELLSQSSNLRVELLHLLRSIGLAISQNYWLFTFRYKLPLAKPGEMDTLLEIAQCVVRNCDESNGGWEEDIGNDDLICGLATDDVLELFEDLRTDVDCMFNLSPAMRNPPKDLRSSEMTRQITSKVPIAPNHHFVDVIRNQFPSAKAFIVEKLGQYNFERYLRLQKERMKNEQQASSETLHLESRTQVSTKFRDSGVGSSLPTLSLPKRPPSMASSVIRGNWSKYPHISNLSSSGEPFECIACGKRVQVDSDRLWKKHLLQDLNPYVCTFEACDYIGTIIGDALIWSDWISHYEHTHWIPSKHSEKCPLCRESIGVVTKDGVANFLKHVSGHLEDIAFTALPKECDSDAEESKDMDDQSISQSMTDKEPAYPNAGISSNTGAPAPILISQPDEKSEPKYEALLQLIKDQETDRIRREDEMRERERRLRDYPPIKFKDAVGRKFSFPFYLCETWEGVEDLICQACQHEDVIGQHVKDGHYDLMGPDGRIISPRAWETVIQPDWSVTMHMWPMGEPKRYSTPPLSSQPAPVSEVGKGNGPGQDNSNNQGGKSDLGPV